MPKTRHSFHKTDSFSFRPSREQDDFIRWFMQETGLTRNATIKQGLLTLLQACQGAIYHDHTCCNGKIPGSCRGRLRTEEAEEPEVQALSPEPFGSAEQEPIREVIVQSPQEGVGG